MKAMIPEKTPKRTVLALWCKMLPVFLFMVHVIGYVPHAEGASKEFTHRLVYTQSEFDNKSINTFLDIMRSGASSGYNGIIAGGAWGLGDLENQTDAYLANIEKAVAEAKKLKMALIPGHFSQGSGSADDFSLVEAFPVRGTPFLVKNKEARSMDDPSIGFKNGGFENWDNGKPGGWRFSVMGNASYAKDEITYKLDKASMRVSNVPSFSYAYQTIKVKPYRAYRISAWFKTQGVNNPAHYHVRFLVNGDQPLLARKYRPFGTPKIWSRFSPNMNWTQCETDFNSLNNTSVKVQLWFCYKTPMPGTVWVDGVRVEEVGLYETIRRRNCPILVKSENGETTYKEGTDYTVDPKSNTFTVDSYWYQGHLKIPQGSAIKENQTLKVDWYQMTDVQTLHRVTNFCLPETWRALKDDMQRIDQAMGHNKWVLSGIDEWRIAFWDDRCELYPRATHAGQYMAETWKLLRGMLSSTNPCREVMVWNDMYDPYGNNANPYGMTNGGTLGAWKGLDSSAIVLNWIGHYAPQSFAYFMGLDSLRPGVVNRQILKVSNASEVYAKMSIAKPLEDKGGKGIIGIAYVHWGADFSLLGSVANACHALGRWGTGPLPGKTCEAATKAPSLSQSIAANLKVRTGKDHFHIAYNLPTNAHVELKAYDMLGRMAKILVSKTKPAGRHGLTWKTSVLPSGIYLLRFAVDGTEQQVLKQVVF